MKYVLLIATLVFSVVSFSQIPPAPIFEKQKINYKIERAEMVFKDGYFWHQKSTICQGVSEIAVWDMRGLGSFTPNNTGCEAEIDGKRINFQFMTHVILKNNLPGTDVKSYAVAPSFYEVGNGIEPHVSPPQVHASTKNLYQEDLSLYSFSEQYLICSMPGETQPKRIIDFSNFDLKSLSSADVSPNCEVVNPVVYNLSVDFETLK